MAQGDYNMGKAPAGILARALTGNIFVEKSLAYMNEGDRDGYNAYKFDIKNTVVAAVAAPTFSDVSEKSNVKRTLELLQSKESFDPKEYHEYWLEFQPTGTFQWESLPANIQSIMEELFLGSSAEAVEDILTNDDGTVLTSGGGLVNQLLSQDYTVLNGASPSSTQIVNNTAIAFRATSDGSGDNEGVALTTTNIFDKIELLIKNQTKEQRKRSGRKFMVSHGTADLISEAQRLELNFKGVDVTEEGIMRYAGYDIIQNPSFPDNTILFCSMTGDMKSDAFQLGTSQSADFNNLAVDRISNFSREWGMLLTFALDIFVVRPEEICFYSDAASIV